MKRAAWIIAGLVLVLAILHGSPVRAGSLEVLVESGRVTVKAHEAPLGHIVQALSQPAGVHVVLDAEHAAQPVTLRLEAGGIHEAIVRLIREAGGGNFAIASSNSGKVETFPFQDRRGAPPAPQSTPAPPPASAAPPADTAGGASTPYAPAPRDPYGKSTTPSTTSGAIVSRSPGPAVPVSPALHADDDDGPASPNARSEIAEEEYTRKLEHTRKDLEKDAKTSDED